MTFAERKIQILQERIDQQIHKVAEAQNNHKINLANFAAGASQRWVNKSGRNLVEAEEFLYKLESRLEGLS